MYIFIIKIDFIHFHKVGNYVSSWTYIYFLFLFLKYKL